LKNGKSVIPRSSTPFKYLWLQSPLSPHGWLRECRCTDVERNIWGRHGDSSSPRQLNHAFINTYWGWIYVGRAPHTYRNWRWRTYPSSSQWDITCSSSILSDWGYTV